MWVPPTPFKTGLRGLVIDLLRDRALKCGCGICIPERPAKRDLGRPEWPDDDFVRSAYALSAKSETATLCRYF
jgi:hypothetical protein